MLASKDLIRGVSEPLHKLHGALISFKITSLLYRWVTLSECAVATRHMSSGTYVSAGQPGTYREARGVNDSSFVRTGPPSNEQVARQCARKGCYTDDTNTCLALGSSIAECGKVDPDHAAQSYADFFANNEKYRGCPPSAKSVMQAVINGTPVSESGLPPHFPFPGGSFANGGGMRISLLPVAYRNASPVVLREAVTAAILSSHR